MQNDNSKKLTRDLYLIQGKWLIWFLAITTLVHVALITFLSAEQEMREMSYLTFMQHPSNIFMLICGIIIVFAYFSYFILNGLTRRDTYTAIVLSSAGIAVTITVYAVAVSVLEASLSGMVPSFSDIAAQPLFDTGSQWILPSLTLILMLVIYYIAGLMIGIGFYRYGGWGGAISIVTAIAYTGITGMLWDREIYIPFPGLTNLDVSFLPVSVLYILTILLTIAGLVIIRLVTKRMPVKME
ncbi:hypothetical protein CR205_02425 [Alteribacter lacisalsi]|uniref:Uncharacterized protein n=1 Tax=Alteribacter lacisalsi TaxID=2045244 RepID=A0A2W0H6H6_9BACI|nr:hypothetical protein [Alteribacter lacisalsi]PYZ97473.1 hypothetical protein CR205_02425 [Alteribacter lacisalsi]